MARSANPSDPNAPHCIEIKLRDLNQLFNTMDPSPFVDKDLDADAEEFILSWAREFPLAEPVGLAIYVSDDGAERQPDELIIKAVHNYFAYRANLTSRELHRLFREGRISLGIGILFLSSCLIIAHLLSGGGEQTLRDVAREGLTIAGWVAMWRPLEIYLYDWVPVRRLLLTFQKLSKMKIEIHREKVESIGDYAT
jgi:hypothetical protein